MNDKLNHFRLCFIFTGTKKARKTIKKKKLLSCYCVCSLSYLTFCETKQTRCYHTDCQWAHFAGCISQECPMTPWVGISDFGFYHSVTQSHFWYKIMGLWVSESKKGDHFFTPQKWRDRHFVWVITSWAGPALKGDFEQFNFWHFWDIFGCFSLSTGLILIC